MLCSPSLLFSSHRPTTISSLMYNDSVTLGLTDNPDDLRSYGMEVLFSHASGWDFYTSIFGLTFRARDAAEGSGRYDELILQAGRLFHFDFGFPGTRILVDVTPFAGITLMGNFGLDWAQNFVHDVFSIEPVVLEYDVSRSTISPHFGSRLSFSYSEPAPWFSNTDLIFRASAEVSHAISYVSTASTDISIGQSSSSVVDVMVGLGYSWAYPYDDSFTHERVTMSETGLTGFLRGRFGLFRFSYRWYLDRLQGYGGMGFHLDFDDDIAWESSDLILSIGLSFPEQMLSSSLRYVLFDDVSVFATNMYKMVPLSDDGRTREIVTHWILGGDYEFSYWDVGWMRPFARLGAGVRRFLVMEDSDSPLDSNGRVRVFSAVCLVVDASAGFRFFPDGRLHYQGAAYGVEVSFGARFSDTDRVIQASESYDLQFTDRWRPYVRVGLTIATGL